TKILSVSKETLDRFGAVSEETILEMANGANMNFNSDYSIAISGVAGPDGGTEEKPVGTIWVGIAGKKKTISKKFQFGSKRIQNIERSAVNALFMLHKLMKEEQEQ
ncbi:MAG: CinA family protein, partial [Daejeonella sp.]|uniref:CinA family protein n=1 Tax=Daejeonella sp. TaxID=2805397 RepID=UPI003C713BBC